MHVSMRGVAKRIIFVKINLNFPNPAQGVKGPTGRPKSDHGPNNGHGPEHGNDHGPSSSEHLLYNLRISEYFQTSTAEPIPTIKSKPNAIKAEILRFFK